MTRPGDGNADGGGIEDLLEAYLDGDLPAESRDRIERDLAERPDVREALIRVLTARGLLELALGGDAAMAGPECARVRPLIRRYRGGDLRGPALAKLSDHLDLCLACQSYARELEAVEALPSSRPARRARTSRARVAVAVGVMVVAAHLVTVVALLVEDVRVPGPLVPGSPGEPSRAEADPAPGPEAGEAAGRPAGVRPPAAETATPHTRSFMRSLAPEDLDDIVDHLLAAVADEDGHEEHVRAAMELYVSRSAAGTTMDWHAVTAELERAGLDHRDELVRSRIAFLLGLLFLDDHVLAQGRRFGPAVLLMRELRKLRPGVRRELLWGVVARTPLRAPRAAMLIAQLRSLPPGDGSLRKWNDVLERALRERAPNAVLAAASALVVRGHVAEAREAIVRILHAGPSASLRGTNHWELAKLLLRDEIPADVMARLRDVATDPRAPMESRVAALGVLALRDGAPGRWRDALLAIDVVSSPGTGDVVVGYLERLERRPGLSAHDAAAVENLISETSSERIRQAARDVLEAHARKPNR